MRFAKTTLCLALSFMVPLAMTGCGKTKTGDDKKTGNPNDKKGGGHPTEGLHGGMLLEVGNDHQYHAELVLDRKKNTATVYILDETAKKEKPIKASEVTISLTHDDEQIKHKLPAKPMEGEEGGVSSRFVLVHDHICHEILDHPEANASLHFTVDGKSRSGKITIKKKKKE